MLNAVLMQLAHEQRIKAELSGTMALLSTDVTQALASAKEGHQYILWDCTYSVWYYLLTLLQLPLIEVGNAMRAY